MFEFETQRWQTHDTLVFESCAVSKLPHSLRGGSLQNRGTLPAHDSPHTYPPCRGRLLCRFQFICAERLWCWAWCFGGRIILMVLNYKHSQGSCSPCPVRVISCIYLYFYVYLYLCLCFYPSSYLFIYLFVDVFIDLFISI